MSANDETASGQYDLLIKGGHLVDPASGKNGAWDVALKAGKVARVAQEIPPQMARDQDGQCLFNQMTSKARANAPSRRMPA